MTADISIMLTFLKMIYCA